MFHTVLVVEAARQFLVETYITLYLPMGKACLFHGISIPTLSLLLAQACVCFGVYIHNTRVYIRLPLRSHSDCQLSKCVPLVPNSPTRSCISPDRIPTNRSHAPSGPLFADSSLKHHPACLQSVFSNKEFRDFGRAFCTRSHLHAFPASHAQAYCEAKTLMQPSFLRARSSYVV